jgi:hypothetical protein
MEKILRVGALIAFMFFIVTCDSLPTWVLAIVAFVCILALLAEAVNTEHKLDKQTRTTDAPIAYQVAYDQNLNVSFLDHLDKDADFKRNFDKEL